MNFTQEQMSEIFDEIAKKKDGYRELLKLSLESIMKAERQEFNKKHSDSSNGYRLSSVFAHRSKLELVIPRSRHHNFYPLILALIKDQDNESKELAFELYRAGLTTEQVGSMFNKIYGQSYSKAAISSMMQTAREDVFAWLERELEEEYPIIYIDATYWHTRRDDSVSNEAYYTILAVKKDTTREVLSIVNHPTEGSSNWEEAFLALKKRGMKKVQLVVCDGLQGIENVIKSVFPQAIVQLYTVHLTRNILAKVKPKHKAEVAADLKVVLNPDNPKDTPKQGIAKFHDFIDKWLKVYPSLNTYNAPRYHLYFNYLLYETDIRRMIYTTNWIERLNRTYKRTLRMRSSMPSPESVLFLIGSTAMDRKEYSYPIYQFKNSSKIKFE
ncbi:MAG: IS256 family transposase [Chitinophagales bacterium]|nr:IS256 family transposase [Chitinophagales bacterium]